MWMTSSRYVHAFTIGNSLYIHNTLLTPEQEYDEEAEDDGDDVPSDAEDDQVRPAAELSSVVQVADFDPIKG